MYEDDKHGNEIPFWWSSQVRMAIAGAATAVVTIALAALHLFGVHLLLSDDQIRDLGTILAGLVTLVLFALWIRKRVKEPCSTPIAPTISPSKVKALQQTGQIPIVKD